MRKDKLFDEYKEQQKKKRREAELINAKYRATLLGHHSSDESIRLELSSNNWKVVYDIPRQIKIPQRRNNVF